MNQPAGSNVQLKSATGPWWVIYGTAGEIVQQIGQVFPHLTQNAQATDFPVIVAQAASEWAQLTAATSQTPGNQSFGGQNQGSSNGFGGQGNGGYNGNSGGGFGGNQGGAPGGQTQNCAHGQMQWKAGTSKASGKDYAGWFCPSKDRNNQCAPVWPEK